MKNKFLYKSEECLHPKQHTKLDRADTLRSAVTCSQISFQGKGHMGQTLKPIAKKDPGETEIRSTLGFYRPKILEDQGAMRAMAKQVTLLSLIHKG